ncbi:MAG: immunoglobulin domain-containing protein [Planctomycetota bacterium]
MTRAEAEASGAAAVFVGNTAIFTGYDQVTANNQDPVVMAFDGDTLLWCRSDYEQTFADGRASGLLWDGDGRLYASFRFTGFPAGSPFLGAASIGWQPSVTQAGNATIGGVFQINENTGSLGLGTFFTARLSNGDANTCNPTGLAFCDDGDIIVTLDSFFSPLRDDLSVMIYGGVGASPFEYRVKLPPTLMFANNAEAIGFDGTLGFAGGVLDSCPQPGDGSVVPPAITSQPDSRVAADVGDAVVVAVQASGSDLQYEWRRDGVPLIDGPRIAGAATDTLVVDATADDDGFYDCVVSNSAGQVTSTSLLLAVRNTCPADQNGDGLTSPADFTAWILNFNLGCQ